MAQLATRENAGTLYGLIAAILVAVLSPAPGAPADIPVELRSDGRPFDPVAPPDFTCFNATLARWVGCRVRKGEAPGLYALERPEPGAYRMHVSIDENPANPRRYPGDYEAARPVRGREREAARGALRGSP